MRTLMRTALFLLALGLLRNPFASAAWAQTGSQRIRLGIPATSVSFLPFWIAYYKGFYKDEGIELEIILMSTTVANPAVLTGDIDYHGGVAALIGAIVRGAPAKALIFTGDRPLHVLISRPEIREPQELKGKRIAGGPAGGMAVLLAERVVKKFGFDPKQDVSILPVGLSDADRLAALRAGIVDAIVIGVPENIRAVQMGYRELVFVGDIVQFPQNGFGTSDRKIREKPDEVLKMVRATLRALVFLSEKKNHEEALGIITRHWKVQNPTWASESFKHVGRFLTKDASVKSDEIKFLIDLARDNAKVTRQFSVEEVVDYSFVERARKNLGLAH